MSLNLFVFIYLFIQKKVSPVNQKMELKQRTSIHVQR